jgi:prothymosin alpha
VPHHVRLGSGHQLQDQHRGLEGEEKSCGGGREWNSQNEENVKQEADNEVDEEEEEGGEEEEEEEEGMGEEEDGDEGEEAEAPTGKRIAEDEEDDDVDTRSRRPKRMTRQQKEK